MHQWSGGNKAHWLARAYSGAFLVRATDGGMVVEASAPEIVDRILDVLAQARTSLSGIDSLPTGAAAPFPRRFEFVHNPQLRPILAQAFVDSARALADGDLESALITSCGILEAIITDALEDRGLNVSAWSFDARIEAAQREGLIGRGCVRLPAVAQLPRTHWRRAAPARRRRNFRARRAREVGPACRDARPRPWPVAGSR